MDMYSSPTLYQALGKPWDAVPCHYWNVETSMSSNKQQWFSTLTEDQNHLGVLKNYQCPCLAPCYVVGLERSLGVDITSFSGRFKCIVRVEPLL